MCKLRRSSVRYRLGDDRARFLRLGFFREVSVKSVKLPLSTRSLEKCTYCVG